MATGQHFELGLVLDAFKYIPAGVSLKVMDHYVQIAKQGRFQQFDYGSEGNQLRYQQTTPPEYNLENFNRTTIYFVSSDADEIATKQDVEWLSEQLPRKPTRILNNVNHLKHFDFLMAKGIQELLYKPLAEFLRRTR